jgi:molybdopterin synthase sulfur carrier subunit
MLHIKFFGQLQERAAVTEWTCAERPTMEEVLEVVEQQFPWLREETFLIAVNREIVERSAVVPAGAEIALMPPFSGG